MATLASTLLDFLLSLMSDPAKVAAFNDDPEGTLAANGLGSVCTDDVDAVMPVVIDYAPVRMDSTFDREYNTGGNTSWVGKPDRDHDYGGGKDRDDDHKDRDDHHDRDDWHKDRDDDHSHAVQQIHNVVNNYSYTSTVDDRDTVVDQSVNQNIWADGDVLQLFDNDAVVSSGDYSTAAGDDAEVVHNSGAYVGDDGDASVIENSGQYADRGGENQDNDVENSGNLADRGGTVEDNDVDASGNSGQVAFNGGENESTDNSGNSGQLADRGGEIEDNDTDITVGDVTIDASDNSLNEAGPGDLISDSDVGNTDVEIEDSFQDNSDNSTTTDIEVEIEDSFNQDNSVETDVEIEDSFNEDNSVDNSVEADVELDVAIEDSFNPEFEDESINDSVIVEDNEVDVELVSETGPGDAAA